MILVRHHRRWLTLFTCVSALLLVTHLTDRFDQPQLTTGKTVRSACPSTAWQRLQRDALRWAAPPRRVIALPRLREARLSEKPERVQLARAPLGADLSSRPPPVG